MEKKKKALSKKKCIALKDFRFFCDELDIFIKEGDDVTKLRLDEKFLRNLITEQVIKE